MVGIADHSPWETVSTGIVLNTSFPRTSAFMARVREKKKQYLSSRPG